MARPIRAEVPRLGSESASSKRCERACAPEGGPERLAGAHPGAGPSASLRHASTSGMISAATSSRSGPASTDVAHQRRAMRDESHAQRPDADPGAGRKLEIFGDAAVEQEALGRIGGVSEFQRVADLVEAFLVEGGCGEGRRAPIAGRDVRSLKPRLELAFVRHELELKPGQRQADIADMLAFPAAGKRRGSGFGRAEAGQKDDALADGLDRELLESVVDMLRQAGAGIEHHLEPAKERLAQCPIARTDRATASRSLSAR